MGDPVRIIDCLEFNPKLRAVDPLDEVAFLCVECDRLGAPWASDFLRRRILRTCERWHDLKRFFASTAVIARHSAPG